MTNDGMTKKRLEHLSRCELVALVAPIRHSSFVIRHSTLEGVL